MFDGKLCFYDSESTVKKINPIQALKLIRQSVVVNIVPVSLFCISLACPKSFRLKAEKSRRKDS
jgi:hypothetical protein